MWTDSMLPIARRILTLEADNNTLRDSIDEGRGIQIERDGALAMLDEILALEDIEPPSKDGSENVASAVGDALEHLRRERDEARRVADLMADAGEMLWVVLANVSGGDWTQQTCEWQEAAAKWRDVYYEATKAREWAR